MELTVKDSKVIERILDESLKKFIRPEDVDAMFMMMNLSEDRTSSMLHSLNATLVKSNYALKLKDILERIGDGLAARVELSAPEGNLEVKRGEELQLELSVTNKFDVPLIFDITVEDRDNFLPVIYNKIEDGYFNSVSTESIIDTEESKKFRFKISAPETGPTSTLLFIVIRSKEIEGLNKINKIRLSFVR